MKINKDELLYKIDTIIDYLKEHDGHNYKVYNHTCPIDNNQPDSNIVEYAEDVKEICEELININNISLEDLPF